MTKQILSEVAAWPSAWREAFEERVAIKMESGIGEQAAQLQAWQEYRTAARVEVAAEKHGMATEAGG